jgi:hypothetical protein
MKYRKHKYCNKYYCDLLTHKYITKFYMTIFFQLHNTKIKIMINEFKYTRIFQLTLLNTTLIIHCPD